LRHESIDIRQGTKQEIISIEVVGALALDPLDLGAAQVGLYRGHDADGDLVLQHEDVGQVPVVAVGP